MTERDASAAPLTAHYPQPAPRAAAAETVVLANARIVLPDEVLTGAVKIAAGEITDISTGQGVPAGAEDCDGALLMPGLIELHTDNLERHISPRPGVDWPHAAAMIAHDAELASTGITTVFDAMRVGINLEEGDRRYARGLASEMLALRAQGALRISHFLHLRAEICTETVLEELDEFGPDDRVGIVSLMDHTPGQRQFRDIEKLKQYHMGKRGLNEAEFIDLVARLKDKQVEFGERNEPGIVARAKTFGAVLASHDDTTEAHVRVSAGHGVHLAEFPTTEEAARACHAHDIAVMMGAPNLIRGGSHSGNVSAAALAEADLLDIVSSDYVPAALLPAALRLGEIWGDLARGFATVTRAPAAAVGLTDRGRIAPGARADLIRVHMVGGNPLVSGVWSAGVRVA